MGLGCGEGTNLGSRSAGVDDFCPLRDKDGKGGGLWGRISPITPFLTHQPLNGVDFVAVCCQGRQRSARRGGRGGERGGKSVPYGTRESRLSAWQNGTRTGGYSLWGIEGEREKERGEIALFPRRGNSPTRTHSLHPLKKGGFSPVGRTCPFLADRMLSFWR